MAGKHCRIIEIEVKSAKLNSIEVGKFYVRVSISESQELQTKLVRFSKTSFNPSWNQKFVFSVPQNFIFDDKSTVSFTVFKARKYFSDIAVGKATAEMRALFPIDECNYDTDDEVDDHEDGPEPEIQAQEAFELKAAVEVPILKGSSVVGTLNVSVAAWEKYYPYELNLYGRARKSFSVFKDSMKVGSMILQKAKQEKYISFVGNVKWRNLAMEFEEFMMQREDAKRSKRTLGMCFT